MPSTWLAPWSTSYALEPAVVSTLVNDVIINYRKSVIEFGAGRLDRLSGKAILTAWQTKVTVISIEDDAS